MLRRIFSFFRDLFKKPSEPPTTVLKVKTHKARKQHICQCCGQYICPGEIYNRITVKHSGKVFDILHHSTCHLDLNK